MGRDGYDAIIIGGGIAGLTAANRLAESGYSTVLFERMQRPGKAPHPCGCIVSPVRGHITLETTSEGIRFKETGFTFSDEMIFGRPRSVRYIGPDGAGFGMSVTKGMPPFQVDNEMLLKTLAAGAREAGATLMYGQGVNGLIVDRGIVSGVRVGRDEVRSEVVISAEGISRKFCRDAGLYASEPSTYLHMEAVCFKGLSFGEEEQGQLSAFGSNYTGIPSCSATFYSFGKDRGMVALTAAAGEEWPYKRPIGDCLQEFVTRCKPIKRLVEKGVAYDKSGCRISVERPVSLTADGFIGAGDSIAPLGRSSIAIAMLMGMEAGDLAVKAIGRGDVSHAALSSYDRWLKSKLFSGVEMETRIMLSMLGMSDDELIRACHALEGLNLEPFFSGGGMEQAAAKAKLMARPDVIKDWKLVRSLI